MPVSYNDIISYLYIYIYIGTLTFTWSNTDIKKIDIISFQS